MKTVLLLLPAVTIALGLAACSRSDTAPRPQHSEVAISMPDAASTPGAVGPGTQAPHATPPSAVTLSDTHPDVGGKAAPAPPAADQKPPP
jgi:hypothetical protein